MKKFKAFLKRKDIEISVQRYFIDALGAMAQGLFCSLLIGTIINTIGQRFGIVWLNNPIAVVSGVEYTVGSLASAMSGPAMACAIGYALKCPPMVLFSLITVGFSANALGGAAVAGCCAQMIGFAVISFRENKWGGLFWYHRMGIVCTLPQSITIFNGLRLLVLFEVSYDFS